MDRNEAIRIVRICCPKISNSECDFETAMRVLVPELKESEDERIRKEIEYIIKTYRDSCIDEGSHKFDECLAWLEKQGEQKPVWSKDDEKIIDDLTQTISQYTVFAHREPKEIIQWLKSIKPQPQWKPTDEQMSCFKQAIDLFKMKVNDDLVLRYLNSLYENLLKL